MARGFNYAPGASADLVDAVRPDLDKAQAMALGSSRNALVRAAIAARSDCPLGLMVSLAHDFSAEVRCAVARNPRAQRTVMAYLSADRSVEVVTALLENPALTPELVEELAFHKKSDVRRAAAARLDAGEFSAGPVTGEDSHNPELAEHVEPAAREVRAAPLVTADGAFAPVFPPSNVVDIATGVPFVAHAQPTPSAPAPTRTAPVRGFKPPGY